MDNKWSNMENVYSGTCYKSVTQYLPRTLGGGKDAGIKAVGWEF